MVSPTVFLIEDDYDVRESLAIMLEAEGFRVEKFVSPTQFLESFELGTIGCLVLDFQMPEMTGLELHDRLKALGSQLPFIIVTGYGKVGIAVKAMRQGAIDFIEKPIRPEQLIASVREAIEVCIQQQVADEQSQSIERMMSRLTTREMEVLLLIAEGLSTKEIAASLGIKPKTIEHHRTSLYRKLNARSVADLMRIAIAHEAHLLSQPNFLGKQQQKIRNIRRT